MSVTASAGTNRGLARIQAVSGLVFATFLVLHLGNTLAALFGQTAYDAVQGALRSYYQARVIEVGLLGAAVVHGAAGLMRWKRRPPARSGTPAPWRLRLHRWSGYYLMIAFAGHVLATRSPHWFYGTPVDFSFVTFSLDAWPAVFYPYYVGLFASGAYHVVHGSATAVRVLAGRAASGPIESSARTLDAIARSRWVAIACIALAVGAVMALGGRLFVVDTHRFSAYRALYERIAPIGLLPWAPEQPSTLFAGPQ